MGWLVSENMLVHFLPEDGTHQLYFWYKWNKLYQLILEDTVVN